MTPFPAPSAEYSFAEDRVGRLVGGELRRQGRRHRLESLGAERVAFGPFTAHAQARREHRHHDARDGERDRVGQVGDRLDLQCPGRGDERDEDDAQGDGGGQQTRPQPTGPGGERDRQDERHESGPAGERRSAMKRIATVTATAATATP